ncbi:protein HtrL [Ditylenchus destructor]|uniref:Protein HtrL n=1 Tax=Ditylenchus destructor TaxID=166010 RepID=A0AAD4NCX2_9BILA|nr:protein HtrL [Ditylenchus destructor]
MSIPDVLSRHIGWPKPRSRNRSPLFTTEYSALPLRRCRPSHERPVDQSSRKWESRTAINWVTFVCILILLSTIGILLYIFVLRPIFDTQRQRQRPRPAVDQVRITGATLPSTTDVENEYTLKLKETSTLITDSNPPITSSILSTSTKLPTSTIPLNKVNSKPLSSLLLPTSADLPSHTFSIVQLEADLEPEKDDVVISEIEPTRFGILITDVHHQTTPTIPIVLSNSSELTSVSENHVNAIDANDNESPTSVVLLGEKFEPTDILPIKSDVFGHLNASKDHSEHDDLFWMKAKHNNKHGSEENKSNEGIRKDVHQQNTYKTVDRLSLVTTTIEAVPTTSHFSELLPEKVTNIIASNEIESRRSIQEADLENLHELQHQDMISLKENTEHVNDNIRPVEIIIGESNEDDYFQPWSHEQPSPTVDSPARAEKNLKFNYTILHPTAVVEPVWRRLPPPGDFSPTLPPKPTAKVPMVMPFSISATVTIVRKENHGKESKEGLKREDDNSIINAIPTVVENVHFDNEEYAEIRRKRRQAPIIVTSLLDIGRGHWDRFTRHFDQYLDYFENLLRLENNFIIYTERKVIEFINKRVDLDWEKLQIVEITLADLPFYRWKEEIQFILDEEQLNWNKTWDAQMKSHPEALYSDYNILVNSKPYFMYNATQISRFDPFQDDNNRFFVWVDAGYGHGSVDVIPSGVWMPSQLRAGRITLLKLTSIIERVDRYTLEMVYRKQKSVISGGFLAGDVPAIKRLYAFFVKTFMDMLDVGKVDDDQTTLLATIINYKSTFNILHGGWFDAFKLLPSQE